MLSRRAARLAAVSLLVLASCRQQVAPAPPPPAAHPPRPPVQVLDALGADQRAWAYVDGRRMRESVLPDLLQAAGTLRADVQVGLAALATACGFQPFLSIEELFIQMAWEEKAKPPQWAAVLRMQEPFDRNLRCLRTFAPEAQETSLDGRKALQLRKAFVVWQDGLFVVARSAPIAQAMLARLAHPEPALSATRAALGSVVLAANLAEPHPFAAEKVGVTWSAQAGSRLEVRSHFDTPTNAARAETILKDSLLQIFGANASVDPTVQGATERFVQSVAQRRDGAELTLSADMATLAGQSSLVTRITTYAARGLRLYTAWDEMGEARDRVYVIARALADYAVRIRALGRAVRFPPSAPLVPDDIPYGKPVVPNPHAFLHPSWQDIRFTSDRPTYYACDFVTAKDGRSVVVRARGDIDGDGTTSLFELEVRLDANGIPIVAPLIRERDPEE